MSNSIVKLVSGGGNLAKLQDSPCKDNPRVCRHGITIEVNRKAGPISESGVVFNEYNKRAKKKMGLPERHAICKPAPSDELGEWAQEFCRQSKLQIEAA